MITRKRLVRWARLDKSRLRGFATVELPTGPEVVNCPVLTSHGTVWAAALPGKPQVDRDGHPRRDAAGKPLWTTVLNWRTRSLREAFSTRVVEFVRDTYPADLEGEAAE